MTILTDASLIYRTVPKTKTSKMKKKIKNKRICPEETVPGKKPWSQSGRGENRDDYWRCKGLNSERIGYCRNKNNFAESILADVYSLEAIDRLTKDAVPRR